MLDDLPVTIAVSLSFCRCCSKLVQEPGCSPWSLRQIFREPRQCVPINRLSSGPGYCCFSQLEHTILHSVLEICLQRKAEVGRVDMSFGDARRSKTSEAAGAPRPMTNEAGAEPRSLTALFGHGENTSYSCIDYEKRSQEKAGDLITSSIIG